MRLTAKKANIDLQLVPVYDEDDFHKIADFFIERDGGSDVTEESTSSDDDDVDTDLLEAPIVVQTLPEATTSMTSDQLQIQADLTEPEEQLQTNQRLSSMEISILQRERDDAIRERYLIEDQYRQLLTEKESYSEQLIKMNNKLKEYEKQNEKLESELNRDKRYTDTSQEQHLEPDDKDNNRPKSETKQSEIQPQTLKQEKKNVIEEQLQIVQGGKTLQEGIPLGQDNEISVQRNQIGQLRVSTATTGGTNNTVSGEMMQVRGRRLSNAGDTGVNENESRPTQQLVSPLHPSNEQSRNRKDDWKAIEQSVGEDLDNGCTSNRYSTPSPTTYYTIKRKMLTASQKGKRRAALPYFRRVPGKDKKGNESARQASVTRKDEAVIGASRISSSRPVSDDYRESHTATSSTWSVRILGTWSSTRTPGNFNCPRGLRWHRTRLVVCDRQNHRVQILDEDNQYEAEIRFDSQFPNHFQPWDVAISDDDKYYITDIGNNQIIVCYQIVR
ncbi:myosin-M heavy chain-like [Ptychodera flava]|uniref:myosin-M heavy chain-like n=1 Tax=Ptychodera flava TaxID=63121 RepID=UPI003969FFE8